MRLRRQLHHHHQSVAGQGLPNFTIVGVAAAVIIVASTVVTLDATAKPLIAKDLLHHHCY